MTLKLYRRVSPRSFAITVAVLTVCLFAYYSGFTNLTNRTSDTIDGESLPAAEMLHGKRDNSTAYDTGSFADMFGLRAGRERADDVDGFAGREPVCPVIYPAQATIDTVREYSKFEFQPEWMKNKEYWNGEFEARYDRLSEDKKTPPLKVILIPHSHNDPGWLKTFEQYFHYDTKQILNNMINKLHEFDNMTFIWSEISFLSMWWDQAHPTKQTMLKKLVADGRVEITTGGWVMTDEATSHVFAMVNQLIDGHQWVKTHLNVKPISGWSVDPFGHGSTLPYLLATSGINGTIIQRIHYIWKQWFAKRQYGDFWWVPAWQTNARETNAISSRAQLLTHNQPFDIYSIKHSCGPHPYICINYDFRKIPGEYTDYSVRATEITTKNVREKSELLLEQFARTGTLFPHNVIIMPIGDDFRYNHQIEWDQQYTNYKMIADYINNNKHVYKNAEIVFGTPKDYFNEIVKRFDDYPTLKGDFFVYSDVFTEGRPAYWSGYFTTRPFVKILDRQLEHNLRNAEILYTIALNRAKSLQLNMSLKVLERNFEKLIQARRNLGLFQHHDAITGTSKYFVMKDYGLKLFSSIQDTMKIQLIALQSLLLNDTIPADAENKQNLLLSDIEYESSEQMPRKLPITLGESETEKRIVLFNSLSQPREEVVLLRTQKLNVKVLDEQRRTLEYQINPIWNVSSLNTNLNMFNDEFEVTFIAKLAPFTISTYYLVETDSVAVKDKLALVYCNQCHRETPTITISDDDKTGFNVETEKAKRRPSYFKIKDTLPGDIQLENVNLKLLFSGQNGFLRSVTDKTTRTITPCAITFMAYQSAQFHSGAYLFMPDPTAHDPEKNVLKQYEKLMNIVVISGPVYSEVTVTYGPFLIHTVRIFHVPDASTLSRAIYIENEIDFEKPPKNRETELFMRVESSVENGRVPEFYSDLNGFQMQRRVKVGQIGIEGNYYPVTTMAYIQDKNVRLSLLTNHALGAASYQPGQLEFMLERRTLYDDSRGMGEGLVDNKRTNSKYWLLIEHKTKNARASAAPDLERILNDNEPLRRFNADKTPAKPIDVDEYNRPSLLANTLSNALNYPVNIFLMDHFRSVTPRERIELIGKLPCDTHVLTFRTEPDPVFAQFPSTSALMTLHRQGYDCRQFNTIKCANAKFARDFLPLVNVSSVDVTSLTGLYAEDRVTNLNELNLAPMTLKTLNFTFGAK